MQLQQEDYFLIPYTTLYKNLDNPFLYYAIITIITLIIFYLTYSIADKSLSLTLQHLSTYCKLSPDIAGVTFLAFGNGAPDFFTAIFGASGEPAMILGSSVGSGLFLICIVFPFVILLGTRKNDIELQDKKRDILPASALFRNILLYLFCALCLLYLGISGSISWWQPTVLLVIYFLYLTSTVLTFYYTQSKELEGSQVTQAVNKKEEACAPEDVRSISDRLSQMPFHSRFIHCYTLLLKHEGKTLSRRCLDLLKAPFDLALNLTLFPMEVPELVFSDAEHVASLRFFHRLRCVIVPWFLCPLIVVLFFEIKSYASLSFALLPLFSLYLWKTSSWHSPPKYFFNHVLLTFAASILWIYILTSELVECLGQTARIAHISPSIVGILVLAWGNSFGDLITDCALAKSGALEMAVSAVFSGPIQNVLLTIGAGFLKAVLDGRKRKEVVHFGNLGVGFYVSIGVLFGALFVIAASMVLTKFKVTRKLAYSLLILYVCYLPVAIYTATM